MIARTRFKSGAEVSESKLARDYLELLQSEKRMNTIRKRASDVWRPECAHCHTIHAKLTDHKGVPLCERCWQKWLKVERSQKR